MRREISIADGEGKEYGNRKERTEEMLKETEKTE
jgi:hypothetical protein